MDSRSVSRSSSSPPISWAGTTARRSRVGLSLSYGFGPILSAGVIAALALLPRRGLTRTVEADGRTSLTIYLAESIVMSTLAAGYGLGLFGLDALPATLLAIAVWLGLLAYASAWMKRFAIGTAEAVLRAITYWRAPALPRRGRRSSNETHGRLARCESRPSLTTG